MSDQDALEAIVSELREIKALLQQRNIGMFAVGSLSPAKLAAEEEITIGRLQGKSVEQIIKEKRDIAIQSKGRRKC